MVGFCYVIYYLLNMNKGRTILATCVIIILVLCGIFSFGALLFYRSASGSGEVVTEERNISGVSKVALDASGSVYIEQGEEESLKIEVEDNLSSKLLTEVDGDTLLIKWKKTFGFLPPMVFPQKEVKYYITVNDLSEAILSGAGAIQAEQIETDSLKLILSGDGEIEFNVKTTDLEVVHSDSGVVRVTGTTENQKVSLSGNGKYDGKDLVSDNCDVNLAGNGSITVTANKTLNGSLSGNGSITYYGDAEANLSSSGNGQIKKGAE